MKKPLFAVFLIVLLSITLLAGCAGSNPPSATESPSEANPTQTLQTQSQRTRISQEEARDIALAHAGVSTGQVTKLRIEFDYDEGVPVYEVDFDHDGLEYDYKIHAETGRILSWDRDNAE